MLTDKQIEAVEILFRFTDEEAIRRLGITRAVLDSWRREPEFLQATAERLRENRQAAYRVISALMVEVCMELAALFREGGDPARVKLLVDIVKAAGLFKYAGEGEAVGGEQHDGLQGLLERLGGDYAEPEPEEED